jgi:hypothetical protein
MRCRRKKAFDFRLKLVPSTNPVDETDDWPMIIPVLISELARSSRRLGHGPLKAEIRVRSPYALPDCCSLWTAAALPRKGLRQAL